eukprot:jgi/Ulvmu1/10195/UM006_0151.1
MGTLESLISPPELRDFESQFDAVHHAVRAERRNNGATCDYDDFKPAEIETEASRGSDSFGRPQRRRARSPNNMAPWRSHLPPAKEVKPRSNPFIDRVDYRGMLKIVERMLQDEANLNEKELQIRSSLLDLLHEHSNQQPPSSKTHEVTNSPEAMRLLRAALKVDNMPSTIAHGSGGTLLQMPLPGPVGVPGWKLSRRGYPVRAHERHGTAHHRWQPAALRHGAVTLDYRVHKGTRVPARAEVDYMRLQRLELPQSQQLKALAFVRYLREQIGPGGRRGGGTAADRNALRQEPGPSAKHGERQSVAASRWCRAVEYAAEMPASAAAVRRPFARAGRRSTSERECASSVAAARAGRVSGAATVISPREALAKRAAGTAGTSSLLRQRPAPGQRLGDQASMRCNASTSVFAPAGGRRPPPEDGTDSNWAEALSFIQATEAEDSGPLAGVAASDAASASSCTLSSGSGMEAAAALAAAAARRSALMGDAQLAPFVRRGEEVYEAIAELNVHHPASLKPGIVWLERPPYVPEDYAALAPGLSNSRTGGEGGWPEAEDWDSAAPPVTRSTLLPRAARARCYSAGLQRFVDMLEPSAEAAEAAHAAHAADAAEAPEAPAQLEECPSLCTTLPSGGRPATPVTAPAALSRMPCRGSTADRDSGDVPQDQLDTLLLELLQLSEAAPLRDPRWLRLRNCALAALPPQPPVGALRPRAGAAAPAVRPPTRHVHAPLPAQTSAEQGGAHSVDPCSAWISYMHVQQQAGDIEHRILTELAPAPPARISTMAAAVPEDGDSEPAGPAHSGPARLIPSMARGMHPVQRLLRPQPLRPRAAATRAQTTLRLMQASDDTAAAANRGDAERALRAVVTRRLHQMMATESTVLNMDISVQWSPADLPCIVQCIQDVPEVHVEEIEVLEGGACMTTVMHALQQLPSVCRLTLHRLPAPAVMLVMAALQDAAAALTALSLDRAALSPASAFDLARSLAVNTALRTLSIRRCALRADSLCELVEMLEENTTLRELDLSWSCDTARPGPGRKSAPAAVEGGPGEAWVALGALARNTVLEVLRLRGCALGDEAIVPLAAAAARSGRLRVLDVSCNAWTWRSVPALDAMLRESTALEHVLVERCRVSRWGAWTLLRVCASLPEPPLLHLRQIDLSDDPDSPVPLDPAWPHGSFTFHLSHPDHRAAAAGLPGIVAAQGAGAFTRIQLLGRTLQTTQTASAFVDLPEHGSLQVTIASRRAVPPTARTLPPRVIDALTAALSSSATESWRLHLLAVAASAARFTCSHAARVLRCFDGADSAPAVLLLLRCVADVLAVPTLEAVAVPDELHAAWRALGITSAICSANPCGHYQLNLSLQAHCIMIAKAHSAQVAQRRLHRTSFATACPLACRNILLTRPGAPPLALAELADALISTHAAEHAQSRPAVQHAAEAGSGAMTCGTLEFDLSRDCVLHAAAPRRTCADSARAATEAARTEIAAITWQDAPLAGTDEADAAKAASSRLRLSERHERSAAAVVHAAHVLGLTRIDRATALELLAHERRELAQLHAPHAPTADNCTTSTAASIAPQPIAAAAAPPVPLAGPAASSTVLRLHRSAAWAAAGSLVPHPVGPAAGAASARLLRELRNSGPHGIPAAEAAVLIKLLWPWQLRLQAVLAMHVFLDTHASLPHLVSAVCGAPFTHASDGDQSAIPPAAPACDDTAARSTRTGTDTAACAAEPTAVLGMIGQCLGWARAGICWWRVDGAQARITLDLGAADDVAQLQRLCAFHSMSRHCRRPHMHGDATAGPGFFVSASVGGVEVPEAELHRLISIRHVLHMLRAVRALGGSGTCVELQLHLSAAMREQVAAVLIGAFFRGWRARSATAARRKQGSMKPRPAVRWQGAASDVRWQNRIRHLHDEALQMRQDFFKEIACSVVGLHGLAQGPQVE